MLPIPVPPGFRIIAHRGASAYAPENTPAAFRLAREMGAREFETDIQLAADGVPVLCHDPSLERFGHGQLVVEDLTSADLLALDMGSWFSPHLYARERMETLDGLLAAHGREVVCHLEIKSGKPELPGLVRDAIRRHGTAANCIVTSFSLPALEAMRAVAPDLRLGWLVGKITADVCARARELALFQICPKAGEIDAEQMAMARQVVPEIRAWGVAGGPQQVVRLITHVLDLGCDGMTINWPDWVAHMA